MLESAKNCLNATLRRAPSFADTYALLALIELRSDQSEALNAAVAYSEKAVALEPANYLGQSAYMQAQFRINHVDAAIAAGRRAIQANPFDPTAKAQLGSILFRAGSWDEGLMLTKEAAELDDRSSRDLELTYMLDAYRRGAFEEALSIANAAECQDCLVKDVTKAASLARAGRSSDAMNAVAEIRRKHPDFDLARDLRANGFSDPLIEMIRLGIVSADPLFRKDVSSEKRVDAVTVTYFDRNGHGRILPEDVRRVGVSLRRASDQTVFVADGDRNATECKQA